MMDLYFIEALNAKKCFIEYLPSENAWVPIEADNYIFIDCLWITGKLKGYGYSNDLLNECINDAINNKKQRNLHFVFRRKKKRIFIRY